MHRFLSSILTLLVLISASGQRALLSDYKVIIAKDGREWLDRNLGAARVAVSDDDSFSFGGLYQWNRANDGHQLRTSLTSGDGPVSNPGVAGSYFYTTQIFFYSWTFPLIFNPVGRDTTAWSEEQNPCPEGFRVPTAAEWQILVDAECIRDAASAFASTLQLPAAGFRDSNNGNFFNVGKAGSYWSGSLEGALRNYYFNFSPYGANILDHNKCSGFSVRCIKEIE